jgi:hypothetical protein
VNAQRGDAAELTAVALLFVFHGLKPAPEGKSAEELDQ